MIDYRSFRPQLAVAAEEAPHGDDWVHEIKLDGYRLLAWRLEDSLHLITRSGQDWTDRFPEIAATLMELPPGTTLDGEVVVFNSGSVSSFGALQAWLSEGSGPSPRYVVFDLLYQDGSPITSMPLTERKERLRSAIEGLPSIVLYSEHSVGGGEELSAEACRLGLEGIISKRSNAPYLQTRSTDWVKVKCGKQEEFVIGGYSPPQGARHGFGALLLGQFNSEGKLIYTGKCGSGFDDRLLKSLLKSMKAREVKRCPFEKCDDLPKHEAWVKPELVAQVRYAERTSSGLLRQPVFLGLREDKPAEDVSPEESMKTLPVEITHPERVLFEDAGLTKLNLAEYYFKVADRMLPYLKDRPLAVVRCPDGAGESCFFQKHLSPGMSDELEEKVAGEPEPLIHIQTTEGLLEFAQFGGIEFHAWASTFSHLEKPDMMTLDLDPGPGVKWKTVIQAAEVTAEFVRSLGLVPFAKISGGKGVHVVVPIKAGSADWPQFKGFSKAICAMLDSLVPGQFVTVSNKAKRANKIYLDYLRNGRGSTAIVPFSARANPDASVAVPLNWSELKKVEDPREFKIANSDSWLKNLAMGEWDEIGSRGKAVTQKMLDAVDFEG